MLSSLQNLTTIELLRRQVSLWREEKKTVALVPTMGALHDGHLSLVKHAKTKADKVIVSIFVNPKQFGVGEDLESYPRDLEADHAILNECGANVLYAPEVKEMYPEGFSTSIQVKTLTNVLCGASRPGHFDGVALVVTKLLLQAMPDIAVFGEKDFQQLLVIKKMVRELDIPAEIVAAPIHREDDKLAMSSRNRYLDKTQRANAPKLYQIIHNSALMLAALKDENYNIQTLLEATKDSLTEEGFKVDYLELRYENSLENVTIVSEDRPARLFVAAWLGDTRLIDNIALRIKKS